jgi:hypothetical protein
MRVFGILLWVALTIGATRVYLGSPDRPARVHGLAALTLADGSTCLAAFRDEDLGGREYVNRWHYLLQVAPGCNLQAFGPEVRHQDDGLAADSQFISIAGWGRLVCQPIDPELRAWNLALDNTPLDYPNGWDRIITLRQIDANVWELLIEQPRCGGSLRSC